MGVVSRDDTSAHVVAGDVEATVEIRFLKTRGSSFSVFACPSCDRLALKLRAYAGRFICRRCALAAGLLYRSWLPVSQREPRAQMQVDRLRARIAEGMAFPAHAGHLRLSRHTVKLALNAHRLRRKKLGELELNGPGDRVAEKTPSS
jgi:hypothetical protein